MLKDKLYRYALIGSILLHLLLFLFYKPLSELTAILDKTSDAAETEPITFELVEPEQPRELVETPEDARVDTPPEDAEFLSDKNARNQDQHNRTQLPEGQAYSEGLSEFNTFRGGSQPSAPAQAQPQNNPSQSADQQKQQDREKREQQQNTDGEPVYQKAPMEMGRQPFSKDLLRQSPANPSRPGANAYSDDMNRNNRDTDARALGGVSLSTYEWEYAPYLLYMKRRLKDRLYLPQTFIRDGAISGDVTIKFRLMRDGQVKNLQFVDNRGHTAFISPTLNTVRASDPFKPLPDSFPDKHLDLTWTFVYRIY